MRARTLAPGVGLDAAAGGALVGARDERCPRALAGEGGGAADGERRYLSEIFLGISRESTYTFNVRGEPIRDRCVHMA